MSAEFVSFYAYDATGAIQMIGACAATDYPLQAAAGLTFAQGDGTENPATEYVLGGVITARPACPVTVSVSGLVVTFSGLPVGSTGNITGDATLTINNTDPGGVNVLTFQNPGSYQITVGCFPNLDYSGSFTLT